MAACLRFQSGIEIWRIATSSKFYRLLELMNVLTRHEVVLGMIHRQRLDYRHDIRVMLEDLIADVFRLEDLPIGLFLNNSTAVFDEVLTVDLYFFFFTVFLFLCCDIFTTTVRSGEHSLV